MKQRKDATLFIAGITHLPRFTHQLTKCYQSGPALATSDWCINSSVTYPANGRIVSHERCPPSSSLLHSLVLTVVGFWTAYDPMQFSTEENATRMARSLAGSYAGVLAWTRDADDDTGTYAPPTILFQSGDVPEMERF